MKTMVDIRRIVAAVLSELGAGNPLAQIAREYGIHPSLPCRWKAELAENPEKIPAENSESPDLCLR
ncbi:hypothetical protein [Methanothrix sp.]